MKKIYINGKFITLEENEKNKVEAILIDDKIIRKVGTKEEILKYQDKETKIIDLKGKTMMPSFIDAHTYYWGDTHIKNFGMERAKNISSAKSTLKQDILFTFHQDAPVIKQDMFNTIWCAVKRKTKNGIILNQNERIEVQDAIKAVTINAAKQYKEDLKGSIKEGKLANLIILDKNPLEIGIDKIKEIQVLETIKEGETLYKNIHNI